MSGDPAARPTVAVVMLTLNQRETTLACLDSLAKDSGYPFRVLVFDQASTDGTADAVASRHPDVHVHVNDANLGVASGRNAGARRAAELFAPDLLLFLDNDMLVEPGFVGALARTFSAPGGERVGQVQAKLRLMDDPGRLNDGGGCRISFVTGRTRPVGYGELDRGQHDRVRPCVSCGGAMMVRRRVFEELGGFDAAFDPFGPEDLDFSLRLQRAGYVALYQPAAVALHAVSHTFGRGYTENYARHKARHWRTFMARHATWWQKAGFYLVGLPLIAARVLVREARRGNLSALRGLARGALDRRRD